MILWSEGATKAQEDEADSILGVLTTAYPGHPWGVRVMEGGFFVKHLAFPHGYGMFCRIKDFDHDSAVLKKQIIMMAGEWLERANMMRGRYDADQPAGRVDGVPERFQPNQPLPDGVEVVIAEPDENEGTKIRDVPRPQAVKNG